MLNLPIGSDTPSRYLGGVGSSGWVCPPEFSFAPALREGFKICLLLTDLWIPDAKAFALSLGKAKALSKAIPIASETP